MSLLCIQAVIMGISAQPRQEFVPLIRDSSLAGWVEVGEQGVWEAEEGVLRSLRPAGYPNWLRSEKVYENFRLHLEYLMPGWCEAGVLVHAPLYGHPSRAGFKVHLRHNNEDEGARSVGSIYDVLEPAVLASRDRGEWNSLDVEVDWPWLDVELNDRKIHSVNMESVPELRNRLRSGFLGFQDLSCRLSVRDLRLQELPGREEWERLSNGKDLSGWSVLEEAEWEVRDGIIVAHQGNGYLISDADYSDFEFQVFVRTSKLANGGVFYRWQSRQERGYEAQIYNVPDATNPTGSIYGLVPAVGGESRDGEWFLLQVRSSGTHSAVRVDGKTVAEAFNLEKPDRGRIVLQMHGRGQIEFLDPRVKLLKPEAR